MLRAALITALIPVAALLGLAPTANAIAVPPKCIGGTLIVTYDKVTGLPVVICLRGDN